MSVKRVYELDPGHLDEVWEMYYECFRELNTLAVQRHLMNRGEFDELMGDKRVEKFMVWTDPPKAALAGLSTFTNELDAVPLISPAYFERHYPTLYAERRIWYCGFVAVRRHGRIPDMEPFGDLVSAMFAVGLQARGLIVLDMCRYNDEFRRMSRVIPLMMHRISGEVRTERLDEQSYWGYDLSGVTP